MPTEKKTPEISPEPLVETLEYLAERLDRLESSRGAVDVSSKTLGKALLTENTQGASVERRAYGRASGTATSLNA